MKLDWKDYLIIVCGIGLALSTPFWQRGKSDTAKGTSAELDQPATKADFAALAERMKEATEANEQLANNLARDRWMLETMAPHGAAGVGKICGDGRLQIHFVPIAESNNRFLRSVVADDIEWIQKLCGVPK